MISTYSTMLIHLSTSLLILVSQCFCDDTEFQIFLEALENPKIATVGILQSAYSNSQQPTIAWSRCEYCTKCPNFDETFSASSPNNFIPCPKRVAILAEKIKHEHDYIRDIWDRYTSEFMGLSEDEVFILRRVYSRNGDMKPISTKQKLSPEMNVTLSKFKLDKVDFDAVVNPPKSDKDKKGEDVTWNKLSFEEPIMGPRLMFGDVSLKGWKGMGTETTALWPIKDGMSRTTVLLYLLDLVELRELGCACIKNHLESNFAGSINELVEICRKNLKLQREELRPAIKLSTCLNPGEETKLRNKNNDAEMKPHKNEL